MHQGNQIVEILQQRKSKLESREAEFRLQVCNWESAAAEQQRKMDQRSEELNQKEGRLRELQFQMLELQNQLIESQLALESIVAELEQPEIPSSQVAALEKMRSELFERFNFVENRWSKMLYELRSVAERITQSVGQPSAIELD
jgi:TolA-binding protein